MPMKSYIGMYFPYLVVSLVKGLKWLWYLHFLLYWCAIPNWPDVLNFGKPCAHKEIFCSYCMEQYGVQIQFCNSVSVVVHYCAGVQNLFFFKAILFKRFSKIIVKTNFKSYSSSRFLQKVLYFDIRWVSRVVKNSAKLDRMSVFFPLNGFTIKLVRHIFVIMFY